MHLKRSEGNAISDIVWSGLKWSKFLFHIIVMYWGDMISKLVPTSVLPIWKPLAPVVLIKGEKTAKAIKRFYGYWFIQWKVLETLWTTGASIAPSFSSSLDVIYQTGGRVTAPSVFPNIEKRVEKMRCSWVFLINFEVFGNLMKHCFKCLIRFSKQ